MNLILTETGQMLISELIAGNSKLTFNDIQLSDHDYSSVDVRTLKSLTDVKLTNSISKVTVKDKNTVEILASVNNTNLVTGFFIKTIGITVTKEDGTVILLGVCQDSENPSYLPVLAEKTSTGINYTFIIKIDDTAVIDVTVGPAGFVTMEMLETKVDKVQGKGLSTYDFNDYQKNEVAKIKDKVDKVPGKQLSTEDFTTEYKGRIDGLTGEFNKKGNIDGFEMKNVKVLSTSWVSDATFSDYPFKATIQVESVTDSHICTAFVPDHTNKLIDGIFSGWSNTGFNSLEIFASEKPADFNIELLRFEKVVI